MKADIHPQLYPTIIVDSSSDFEFKTLSTQKTEETREEDGVTYNVLRVEISSASHPFYTGKQKVVDAARRVEKFEAKAKVHAEKKEKAHRSKREKQAARKAKKAKKTTEAKKSAKDALKAAKSALADL